MTENTSVIAWEWFGGHRKEEWTTKGHRDTFEGNKKMFIILTLVIYTWMYAYVKTHQIVHFKYVWLIVSQLYLNRSVKNLFIDMFSDWTLQLPFKKLSLKKRNCHLSSFCVIVKKNSHNYLERLLRYYSHFKLYTYVWLFFFHIHHKNNISQQIECEAYMRI